MRRRLSRRVVANDRGTPPLVATIVSVRMDDGSLNRFAHIRIGARILASVLVNDGYLWAISFAGLRASFRRSIA